MLKRLGRWTAEQKKWFRWKEHILDVRDVEVQQHLKQYSGSERKAERHHMWELSHRLVEIWNEEGVGSRGGDLARPY